MESITFDIESNAEIISLFDKSVNNFFIQKFDPHQAISWFKADLKLDAGFELKNANVRSMEFDLQTDMDGLKTILALNTNRIRFNQFDRKLPDKSRNKILKSNGLKHFFWIDFEFITIKSFDSAFIKLIKEDPVFGDRIRNRKNTLQQNL